MAVSQLRATPPLPFGLSLSKHRHHSRNTTLLTEEIPVRAEVFKPTLTTTQALQQTQPGQVSSTH